MPHVSRGVTCPTTPTAGAPVLSCLQIHYFYVILQIRGVSSEKQDYRGRGIGGAVNRGFTVPIKVII